MNSKKSSSLTTYLYTVFFNICNTLGIFAIKAARILIRAGFAAFVACQYAFRAVKEMFEQWYEELVSRGKAERKSIGRMFIDFCNSLKNIAVSSVCGFKSGVAKGIVNIFKQTGALFALLWKSFAPALNYIAPASAIVVAVVVISHYSGYGYGLAVEFKGSEIGVVENEAVFNSAITDISTRVEEATGLQYTVNVKPTYTLVMMNNPEYTSADDISNKIVESTPELFSQGYGLFIDDELIAVNDDKSVLESAIDKYLLPYKSAEGNDDAEISFVESVDIREGLYLVTKKKTAAQLERLLNTPIEEEVRYTIQSGDTIERIANNFETTVDELSALNEGIDDRYIYEGEEIIISSSSSLLKVSVTKTEIYEEKTEIPVIEIENDSIYKGTKKTISEGSSGTNRITASVSYIDGVEVSREILSEETVEEAVAKRIYVGTKEKPKTVATGNWIRPIKGGSITSRYGWRTIYGSRDFHKGIDFAAPKGTEIYAVDGGTIVYMGTLGTYGKLVKVDHGNGYVSFYAHCSAFADLKVGDKVYQGQTIAYVGSTGRSTGNHVHLEIRYDNEPTNINDIYC